jgi:signal peptidase
MEPAFYRGDLLFLTNPSDERYHTGDITVYKVPGADIPIVHRVLETHDNVGLGGGAKKKRVVSQSEYELYFFPLTYTECLLTFLFASRQVSNQLLLTKGDNNYVDDIELYQGLDWLERKHIVGKVRGSVSIFHPFRHPGFV